MDMSVPFAAHPAASILRTVINGDSAISPSSQSNVVFEAYDPKVHGLSMSGTVPWSSFSSPVPYSSGNPQVVSSDYYGCQISFASALTYVPFFSCIVEGASGWGNYTSGGVTYYNSGGIFLPQGTAVNAGAFATQTYIFLYLQVLNFVNPVSWSPPIAYSYRLYGA